MGYSIGAVVPEAFGRPKRPFGAHRDRGEKVAVEGSHKQSAVKNLLSVELADEMDLTVN